MVSNRFSGKRTIKLPVVCHKELYGLPLVYATELPTQLSAVAIWRDHALPIAIAESFPLVWSDAIPGWSGRSGDIGFNLAVTVVVMAPPNTYDFQLELRHDTSLLDDDSWHAKIVKPPRPFDPGLLMHVYNWPIDYNELRILN